MVRTILGGGLLFDGSGGPPFRADVAIEGGRIAALGTDLGDGRDDVERIDVAGRTLLPGLIDCHAHLGYWDLPDTDEDATRTPSYRAFAALRSLRATIGCGITTVRDAGGADAGFRRAVDEGLVIGPRMLVSLAQLSPTGGPSDGTTPSGLDLAAPRPGIPSPVADGPDALRARVRAFVAAGADVIKVFATGHWAMARDGRLRRLFTDDELRAIVDEASAWGLRVMAHAHGAVGIEAAARAGAASVEHGYYLDDAAIEQMAARGTWLVPTLLTALPYLERAGTDPRGPAALEEAQAIVEAHRAAVGRAHRAGVRIAMGTDSPVTPHGRNLGELRLLVACGLTASEALVAATSSAAALLGLDQEVGRIAPGFAADIVTVRGDALDLEDLEARIDAVRRAGLVVASGSPV